MREPFFNDLSNLPLCKDDEELKERITKYARILEFCGALGFMKVRYEKPIQTVELKKDYSLHQYIVDHGKDNDVSLILNMVRRPYLDEDSAEEEKYVNSIVKLNREGQLVDAEGLTCAYVSNGFAVGFSSEDFWSRNYSFEVSVLNQINGDEYEGKVYCISEVRQFQIDEFVRWMVGTMPLQFRDSHIPRKDKKKHFRQDHGLDILDKFADKILKEPYIVEVVNSLPFQRHATDIVGEVKDDGLIELILTDTDDGYGMVIRTTAKSRMEALYHAADIRKKYQQG